MFDINQGYETKEELSIGDTRMRLLTNGKRFKVQLWSSLSSCWRDTYRQENALYEWNKMKKLSN